MEYAPTHRSPLELFTPVKTVSELEQTDIVLCYLVDEVTSRTQLTKRELIVVFVVKDVHEGGQEGVKILFNPSIRQEHSMES